MAWTVDGEMFTRRVEVTIPAAKVDDNMTNKDVFIDLSLFDAAWWADVKNGGGDIRLTSSDGTTRLALEVTSCNTATSEGEGHGKLSSISSSTATVYYVYCGNAGATQPGAGTTYGSQAVWDANHVVVYHLEDANDSTANGYHLTASASAPTSAAGKLGGSADGGYGFVKLSEQRFSKTNETALQISGDWTISAWVKSNGNLSANNYIISKGSSTNANYYAIIVGDDMYGGCYSTTDSGFISAISTTPAWDDSAWHYVQVTCIGTTVELWVDGVSKDTATDATVSVTSTDDLTIGGVSATNDMNGWEDEARVSDIGRPDAELTFEFNNQNDPSTFFTVAASEGSAMVYRTIWYN